MEVANTLAYYDTATITPVKSFKVQAPDENQASLENLEKVDVDSNAATALKMLN